MMNLGGYSFEIGTTPYQELTRQTGWDWPEQQLIGSAPAMQYTGKKAEKISMRGMLLPGFTGDRSSIEALRLLGDQAKPLPLVTGQGFFLGLWVIESIEQSEDVHFSDGTPRRMSFSIELKKYADTYDGAPQLGNISRALQIFA